MWGDKLLELIPEIVELLKGSVRVIQVVLLFSILVIAHEYGHFLMAKACNMRVDEFAIGFGKNLFSWTRGETVYSINLFPIGGYNKIYGMDVEEEEEELKRVQAEKDAVTDGITKPKSMLESQPDYSLAPADDPRAFVNRPLYQRFATILAGPVANILVAIFIVFLMGVTIGFPAAELGGVVPGGPADIAGLQKNDVITHLNGARISTTNDILQAVAFSKGEPVYMSGSRGAETFDATVYPREIQLVSNYFCRLGFIYRNDGTILYVLPDSPAKRSSLMSGDNIVSVDGFLFPSSRLEVEDGSGFVSLEIYRGMETSFVEVDYFHDELIRDIYSPYLFFYRECTFDLWNFTPVDTQATNFHLVDFNTSDGLFGWVLSDPDGVIEYNFDASGNSMLTWEGLDVDTSYSLSLVAKKDTVYDYSFTIDGETLADTNFVGTEIGSMVVGVVPGGIADDAGLMTGDRILGGIAKTWNDSPASDSTSGPLPITIEYQRGSDHGSVFLEPDNQPFSRILVYVQDASLPVLVDLPYDHRLARAGVRSGDEIKSIGGVPTPNGIVAFLQFQQHFGEVVSIVVMSGGEERVIEVPIPGESDPEGLRAFFAGLRFKIRYFRSDITTSLLAGVRKAQDLSGFIFMMIGMLVSGQASAGDLVGPVGIMSITYEAASNGLVDLIHIMVFLSINLAIFNLLPFPALDGGRIIFMIPEMIARRKVITTRIENIIHIAGFMLLIAFALFITYQDIARLFFGR